jgi:hypothetical protein
MYFICTSNPIFHAKDIILLYITSDEFATETLSTRKFEIKIEMSVFATYSLEFP